MSDPDGRDTGRPAAVAVCLLLLLIGLVGIVSALKDADTDESRPASAATQHTDPSQ